MNEPQQPQLDWIEHEPTGSQYDALIDYLAGTCSSFALVVRDFDELLSVEGLGVLTALVEAELERVETSEWPGTRLIGHTATVIRFHLDASTAAILRKTVARLYSWRAPRFPEDLSFYRPDGSCMLAVTAHERAAFFEALTPDERDAITELGIKFETNADPTDHPDAMCLEDGDRRVSLAVTGYQFPDREDFDWLLVRVEAADERGTWTHVDPSLAGEELPKLANWLDAAASDQPQPQVKFLEPNIRFEVLDHNLDGVVVRVSFELESRPPWSPSRIVEGDPYIIDLTVSRDALTAAAEAIRRQHAANPLRPSGR